ncbi:MAG TPA: TIGR00645 family protein [Caulobacteraceae bacterium]|jgi:uncharacterized protein (TIGR00645 family)|nr:TIGR00645 family protein [Caulobacteraceae bacterium]
MPETTYRKPAAEVWLERGLFASRWLMAPFYVGLVIGLAALLAVFAQELWTEITRLIEHPAPDEGVVMALSLIDLSLAANLMLIVIFSGYENFVSRIDVAEHVDRPAWMGTLDFTGLKMKLIASIVAISAVALLRAFMGLAERGQEPDPAKLGWLVGLHLTFVVSGVMMALMDWLEHKSEAHGGGGGSRGG